MGEKACITDCSLLFLLEYYCAESDEVFIGMRRSGTLIDPLWLCHDIPDDGLDKGDQWVSKW